MKDETKKYIVALVNFFDKYDKKISYGDLIKHLKFNGINDYRHPRGIGRGLSCLYDRLVDQGRQEDADKLYLRIVKADGKLGREK